jgi:hypothetical protein
VADRIQLRGDVAVNWTAVDPVLADREVGLETDTNQIKIGNGLSHWTSLPYGGIVGPAGSASITSNDFSALDSRVGTLSDTISNEISNRVSVSAVLDAKISSLSALVISGIASVDARATSLETRISTVSGLLGGGVSITSTEYTSLVSRVSANSAVGGGGSVTSNEVSAIESRVGILSDAISNETSNRISISAVLDAKISNLSASHISLASSLTSVDGRVTSVAGLITGASVTSNELSVIKDLISNETSNRVSISAVLDGKISSLSALVISGIASINSRATSLESRLSTLSTTVVPYYAFPTGVSVTAGTLVSGTFAGLSAFDGGAMLVSEVISTLPIGMTIQFSAVSQTPNRLLMRAFYEGNNAHSVHVEIFNHTTSVWDLQGVIPQNTGLQFYEFTLYSGADNVSANNAKIRIQHNAGGNANHSFQLDYAALAKLITGAGITNHGALQGLTNDDHLQYALADGSRGFSVVSNAVSALDVRVGTLSDLISNEISNRVSVSAVLDTKISNLSAAHASIVSSLTSVDSRATSIKSKVSVLSALVISGLTSIDGRATSLESRISTVSGLIGGGGSITSLEYLSLVDRVSANSAVGGGGSVTSDELSIVKDLISNEISNRVSISAILDAKISNLSTEHQNISLAHISLASSLGSVDTHADNASAAATSVDGRLNSVVSTLISAIEVHASTASAAATSVELRLLSIQSAINSVIEVHASTASAAATSVDARINSVNSTIGSAVTNVSCVSGAGSATGLQNVIQALSVRVDTVSNANSVTKSALINASTTGSLAAISLFTSISATLDAKISTVSTNYMSVDNRVSVLSGLFSGLSQTVSLMSNAVSALEVRHSTLSADHVSLRNAYAGAPATSAAVTDRIQALSTNMTYGGQVSLDRFSIAFMSVPATCSASALTAVSGTTIQVSANSFYILQGMFALKMGAAGLVQTRLGLTIPACNMLKGQMQCTGSIGSGALTTSLKNYSQPILAGVAGGSSAILAILSTTGTEYFVIIDAILNPSATGNIIFMAGAAAGASAVIVSAGGFLRTEKLR